MKKKLLITGSNRGLGLGIARLFYSKSFNIISLNKTICGNKWLNEYKCDIRYPKQISKSYTEILKRFKTIDLCILNAAIRRIGLIKDLEYKDWVSSIETNLTSVFYMLKLITPELLKNNGHIFIIGSHAASNYFEGGAAYCSTKAALKALCEVFILETKKLGLKTTLISAGAVNNREEKNTKTKIDTGSLGKLIYDIYNSENDLMTGEIEVRPAYSKESPVTGIERLQYI